MSIIATDSPTSQPPGRIKYLRTINNADAVNIHSAETKGCPIF